AQPLRQHWLAAALQYAGAGVGLYPRRDRTLDQGDQRRRRQRRVGAIRIPKKPGSRDFMDPGTLPWRATQGDGRLAWLGGWVEAPVELVVERGFVELPTKSGTTLMCQKIVRGASYAWMM